jgi:hypothetical protein
MRRFLLAPFPALAVWIGLAYLLGDPQRTESPSFAAAKLLAPMHVWGVLFLFGGVVLTLAMLVDDKRLLSWALFAGGFIFTWWAVMFGYAAATDPRASLTGPAIHGTLGLLQFSASWWIGREA